MKREPDFPTLSSMHPRMPYICSLNSNLDGKMSYIDKGLITDFDSILSSASSGQIIYGYITLEDTSNVKGFPIGANGWGTIITIGGKLEYLKLQMYISESNNNTTLYWRTRCNEGGCWNKITGVRVKKQF